MNDIINNLTYESQMKQNNIITTLIIIINLWITSSNKNE